MNKTYMASPKYIAIQTKTPGVFTPLFGPYEAFRVGLSLVYVYRVPFGMDWMTRLISYRFVRFRAFLWDETAPITGPYWYVGSWRGQLEILPVKFGIPTWFFKSNGEFRLSTLIQGLPFIVRDILLWLSLIHVGAKT